MMTGTVNSDEGRIRLRVNGPYRERKIEAVIGTGYTGSLSLPPALVAALALDWQGFDRALLADGSEVVVDVYEAAVIWDGKPRSVPVDELDTDPLVGMALLRGYELKMQIRRQGKITIKRLS
jgi:clan AA aspartic protease